VHIKIGDLSIIRNTQGSSRPQSVAENKLKNSVGFGGSFKIEDISSKSPDRFHILEEKHEEGGDEATHQIL
jgi:hypothetical protein